MYRVTTVLHLAYNSSLLQDCPLSMTMLREVIERTSATFPTQGSAGWWEITTMAGSARAGLATDQHGQPYPEVAYHMMAALLTLSPRSPLPLSGR